MALYTPHTLVQVGGGVAETRGGPAVDAWSVGVRMGDVDGTHGPVDDPAAMLLDVKNAFQDWFEAEGSAILHPAYTVDWVKVNNIGADGKYSSPVTHRYDYTPSLASAAVGGNFDPGFVTLCGTFQTPISRGRASKGRMYFPLAVPTNASDVVAISYAQVLTGHYRHILQAFSGPHGGTPGFPFDANAQRWTIPGVYSGIDGSRQWITATSVGIRKDSQRRRKNDMPEQYQVSPYEPAPPA